MDQNAIFSVEFDKEKFVNNVSEAIKSSEKFEDKMEALSQSANKINFSKPISQLNRLKEELTSAFKSQNAQLGLSGDQINKSVDNIVKSGPKIKEFLNALKKDLKSATDPEEFKNLRESIKLTENALAELTGEEVKNETATKSAKARLREMKQELISLEDAGLDDTEMFRQLTIESARLTDQLGDQAEQIRVLSSDTFGLDAGVDILKQLAAGWQLTEGAMQLAGISTEETEAQMQKLVAIQSVMNGLQEVHAFLTGQSAGKLAILNGWNKAVAVSTALVATVTGEATVATRIFSTAIAATGIGALVIALGILFYKWEDIKDAITGASDATRAYDKASEESISGVQKVIEETEKMKDIFEEARQGLISKSKALKIYNENFGEVYGTAKSFNEAESTFIKKTPYYLQAIQARETATALYKIAAEKQAKSLISYNNKENTTIEQVKAYTKALFNARNPQELKKLQEQQEKKDRDERKKKTDAENEEIFKLAKEQMDIAQKAANLGSLNIDGVNAVKEEKTKKEKQKKQVENIYKDLLNDFQSQLNSINNADKKGLSVINAAAEENYRERINKINDALKDGKLSSKQAADLRKLVLDIKKSEIESEVNKFQEARANAIKEADKQQQDLDDQLAQSKIDNIQKDYDREIELIKLQETVRLKAIENSRKDGITEINNLKKEEYINEEEAQKRIQVLNNVYDQLIIQAKLSTNKQLQDENLKRLDNQKQVFDKNVENLKYFLQAQEAIEIKQATDRFNAGTINEETLNSEISKIHKKYQNQNKLNEIKAIDERISYLKKEQEAVKDNAVKVQEIQNEIYQLQKEKTELQTKKKKSSTFLESIFGTDEEAKRKAESVQNLVKTTIQTSIDLLKEQARLEVEAYDRAITLQQGRVDEARKIADAGNAEYLQQETDRLNELEAKREQSARRQLEIDQAVQASQILVAVAGAAAQIAKGGTVNVITGLASVIAAIGSGVTLVNQMRSNAPKFYDGTEYVELNGNPDGRDTVPAWLNKGERIVPNYINEQLKGIKNKDLPKLVNGELFYNHMIQVNDKDLPKTDDNSELRKEVRELKLIQAEQLEYLKALGINIVMDSEGFSASLETASIKKKKMFNA